MKYFDIDDLCTRFMYHDLLSFLIIIIYFSTFLLLFSP